MILPSRTKQLDYGGVNFEERSAKAMQETTTMTDLLLLAGSVGTTNPMSDFFRDSQTDLSISNYGIVPIQTLKTGINPVEFQVDPQEDYVDLSRIYFDLN